MEEKNTKANKNLIIEVARGVFASIIVLHHLRMYSADLPYGGGYMATDFFFMLSGYLLFRSSKKNTGMRLTQYFRRRYVQLVIPLVICNSILVVIEHILTNYELQNGVVGFIRENLMVEFFISDSNQRYNGATWYLGIMMMVSIVIWIIMVIDKEKHGFLLGFCALSILAYAVTILYVGCGNIFAAKSTFFDWNSFLRGCSGMSCGLLIALAEEKFECEYNKQIYYIGCLILMITDSYLLLWGTSYTRMDIFVYFLLVCSLFVFTRIKYFSYSWLNLFITKIGKASFVVYILHFPVARIFTNIRLFDGLDWKVYSILFLLIVWGFSIVVCDISELIKNVINRRLSDLKEKS